MMNQYSDLLEIQSFGRVAFTWRASRQPLTLAPREEALLLYLAVQGVAVRRTQLCDLFWPGEPAPRARGNLRKLLVDVRKSTREFLCSDRDVVWLAARPYWFDLHEFERLTQAAMYLEVPRQGLTEADFLRLAEGIRLYHGDFLVNFKQPQSLHFVAWLEQEQRLWHHRAGSALSTLIEHTMQQGDLAKATAYARRLLEIDPFHEEAHGQLMRLLTHQDQQAEAIEHYQAYSQLVNKELKTTVEGKITDLYRQIRSGILPALLPDRSVRLMTHSQRSQTQPQSLPNPMTPLLGRSFLLTQLNNFLHNPAVRLITLTGLGGIGKSRVALAVAAQAKATFQQQVYYVPLDRWRVSPQSGSQADQHCYSTIVQATAESFALSADLTDVALDQQICTELRSRTLLLLFDGFEALVEGSSFLLKLLQEAPGVKILVTSREVLQLPGELVIQIDGLAWSALAQSGESRSLCGEEVDSFLSAEGTMAVAGSDENEPSDANDFAGAPAVQLFTSCAQRQNPTLTFTTSCLQQIATLCALLEGNPLAIELAAGLTIHYAYGELITLLRDTIQLLQAVGRGGAQRHHSIEQTLEESWHSLSTVEQETLTRLSHFAERFHRTQALQLEGVSPQPLISLTAKSMLRSHGAGWYQLPRLVQLFARQKIATPEG